MARMQCSFFLKFLSLTILLLGRPLARK